jgi:hypothetical protein
MQIAGEKIELGEFRSYDIGDDIGCEIYPQSVKIRGIRFAIKRSLAAEVESLMPRADGKCNLDYSDVGSRFEIAVDLSSHIRESTPDEHDTG